MTWYFVIVLGTGTTLPWFNIYRHQTENSTAMLYIKSLEKSYLLLPHKILASSASMLVVALVSLPPQKVSQPWCWCYRC